MIFFLKIILRARNYKSLCPSYSIFHYVALFDTGASADLLQAD
jgi:hypothetical protein